MPGLKTVATRLDDIARLLAIPVAAFTDPLTCDFGQTAELLSLWHRIDDPNARLRVLSAMRAMAGRADIGA